MPTQITSYTTNEEVASIYAHVGYQNADGSVNFDAIAQDIQDGQAPFAVEDLITAYVTGTGSLPAFMMAPEAQIPDPESVSHLWEEEVTASLQELGQLYSGNIGSAVTHFLSFSSENGANPSSTLGDVEDFLNNYVNSNTGINDPDPDPNQLNPFVSQDLKQIMSLFMAMGNPGIALLFYTAYGANPALQRLQSAALDVIDEGGGEMKDLLDKLQDLGDDPENFSAQYESQVISQKMNVISAVSQTMTQFIKDAQDVLSQLIQMSSNLSEQSSRTLEAEIRNMG